MRGATKRPEVAVSEGTSRYVIDTHALKWYLLGEPQLGLGASAALRLVELGEAQLLIPAIVLAELVYVFEKKGIPLPIETVALNVASSSNMLLVELGMVQLAAFEKLDPSLEMHDRLILADAIVAEATLITRDYSMQRAGLVPTIW